MWDAHVYFLAVLIAFFSGSWPYVKLFAMFLAWVVPPRFISVPIRNSIIEFVDTLGKWSLIDAFVMVMLMVAFFFKIYIGSVLDIYVTVYPELGFYTFILATLASLIIGHFTLHFHRAVVENSVSLDKCNRCQEIVPVALMNFVYSISPEVGEQLAIGNLGSDRRGLLQEKQEYRMSFTLIGKVLVLFWLVGTFLLLSIGVVQSCFQFEFRGLVGLLLKTEGKNVVVYSFYDVGLAIPAASGNANDPYPYFIVFIYFLLGFIVPVFLCVIMTIIWTVPIVYSTQTNLFIAIEVLNCWSALDVFCLSVFATILEIKKFVTFIVGDSCDQINEILQKFLDKQLNGDDVCFDLDATIHKDGWIVFVSAALIFISVTVFLSFMKSALSDKERLLRFSAPKIVVRTETILYKESIYSPLLEYSDMQGNIEESYRKSSLTETPDTKVVGSITGTISKYCAYCFALCIGAVLRLLVFLQIVRVFNFRKIDL